MRGVPDALAGHGTRWFHHGRCAGAYTRAQMAPAAPVELPLPT